jgi:hypothetical protein
LLGLLRDLALEYSEGVPEVVLLDRAREVGLGEGEVREVLRELVIEGEVISPAPGAYLPGLSGEEEAVFRRFYREFLRAWVGESELEPEYFLDFPEEAMREVVSGVEDAVVERVVSEVERLGTLQLPSCLIEIVRREGSVSESELVRVGLPRLPVPDPGLVRETLEALRRAGDLWREGDRYRA